MGYSCRMSDSTTPGPTVVGVQVGLPRTEGDGPPRDPLTKPWTSAFDKRPVGGRVRVGALGLEGDGVADPKHHGGPGKAVLMVAASHYPAWRAEFAGVAWGPGAMGENLTVAGLDEAGACVGDSFRVGSAVLQVSQPREPCWKIDRRWQTRGLTARCVETGRGGWHTRVIEPGDVSAGDAVELLDRPEPALTVSAANDLFFRRSDDADLAARFGACPLLEQGWRDAMRSVAATLARR